MAYEVGVKLAVEKSIKEIGEGLVGLVGAQEKFSALADKIGQAGNSKLESLIRISNMELINSIDILESYIKYFQSFKLIINLENIEKEKIIDGFEVLKKVVDDTNKENVKLKEALDKANKENNELREKYKSIEVDNVILKEENIKLNDFKTSRVNILLDEFEGGMKSIQLKKKFIENSKDNRESSVTNEELIALYSECKTNVEISNKLGGLLTPAGVKARLEKIGIYKKKNAGYGIKKVKDTQ